MKIAFIGKFNELHDEEGKARSFEKIGCEVLRIDERRVLNKNDIRDFNPDIFLFTKLQENLEDMRGIFDFPQYKVSWHPDLYRGLWRERLVGRSLMWRADLILSPDGGDPNFWKVNHEVLRQGIYDEDIFVGEKIDAPEIVFVGSQNNQWEYRNKVMNFLKDTYKDRFEWVGKRDEWRNKDLNNLYSSVKIVIGDSVYSEGYWSNRIYETIGRGGFLIHPDIPQLKNDYTYYRHFIPYRYGDLQGLKNKIDYYLLADKDRQKIIKAGMEHTKNNHTLIHRCQKFLNIVQKNIGKTELKEA